MSQSGISPVRAPASPLGLRAVHALVFLGFGAAAAAGMMTELRQLSEGLFYPWHFGSPPSAVGVAAALTALLLCAGLVVFLFIGRSAPIWMSVVMLLCLLGSIFNQDYPFSRRSAPGANLQMLEVAKLLHEEIRLKLQATGRVPARRVEWEQALIAVVGDNPKLQSSYHRRFFARQPWRAELIANEGDFLADAAPGTFQIYVPTDASRFTLTMLGLDSEHQVVRLRDDQGEVFALKGVFTPDTLQ